MPATGHVAVIARDFFRDYVADRRRNCIESFDHEDLGHLVRYTARPSVDGDGMVAFARLHPGSEAAAIREQVVYFGSRGRGFEWKVYALDEPADLRERLAAEGFVADDEETFMVCPLNAWTDADEVPPRTVEVRRVDDARELHTVMAVQRAVWGEDIEWLRTRLATTMSSAPASLSIYCAFIDGHPVGSGWTDFPAGSRYPELRGGSVIAEARGLGVYSALFRQRMREAVARGHEAICVDALPTSRPILEHIGFVPICSTVPMRWAAT